MSESMLAKKLRSFIKLSEPEERCLGQLQSAPIQVLQGKELVHEGQARQVVYILQHGWASSYFYRMAEGRSSHFPSRAIASDCAVCCCKHLIIRSPLTRTQWSVA